MKPTPKQIKDARIEAGLTQEQAAKLAGLGARERWAAYESGVRSMPVWRWEFFRMKLAETTKPP